MPFAFSSNGDAFLFHDRTGQSQPVEQELTLNEFPSAEDLWQRYCLWKGLTPTQMPKKSSLGTIKSGWRELVGTAGLY
jgi:type I restriction enzyme R subunit